MEHSKTAQLNPQSSKSATKLTVREKILYSLAVGSMLAANVAVYIALFLPPEGEVHSSILGFFGMVCAFSAAMFGISADFRSSLVSFRTEKTDSSK